MRARRAVAVPLHPAWQAVWIVELLIIAGLCGWLIGAVIAIVQ